MLNRMTQRKIGVGVHYLAIPEHPYYQKTFGWKTAEYPNAVSFGQSTLSIPISPKLTFNEVDYIIESVLDIIKNKLI